MVIDEDDLTREDAEQHQGVNFFLDTESPDAVSDLRQATSGLRDSLRHLDGAEVSHHTLVLGAGHVHVQLAVVVQLDALPQLTEVVGEEIVELTTDIKFFHGVQLYALLRSICAFPRRRSGLRGMFDVHKARVCRVAPDMSRSCLREFFTAWEVVLMHPGICSRINNSN